MKNPKDPYDFEGFIDMLCELNTVDEIEQAVQEQMKLIDRIPPTLSIFVPEWDEYNLNVNDIYGYLMRGKFRDYKEIYQPLVNKLKELE